jgi:hypothetical protein
MWPLQKKILIWPSICNRVQTLVHAADWLDSLIGPDGLLLVLSDQCAVPALLLWVELEKGKKQNLNVRNISAGSHTEHRPSCSYKAQATCGLYNLEDLSTEYIGCFKIKGCINGVYLPCDCKITDNRL